MNDLKSRIIHEFAKAKPPNINDIAEAQDWDAVAINEDFSSFLSKPVDKSILESHAKSLPAFTPSAFVFFLKDYMVYTLDNHHEIGSTDLELMDSLSSFNNFTPSNDCFIYTFIQVTFNFWHPFL